MQVGALGMLARSPATPSAPVLVAIMVGVAPTFYIPSADFVTRFVSHRWHRCTRHQQQHHDTVNRQIDIVAFLSQSSSLHFAIVGSISLHSTLALPIEVNLHRPVPGTVPGSAVEMQNRLPLAQNR